MDWSLLGFKGLGQVLNVHPVFVHFPIALFPTTLLFYFIGIVFRKEKFLFTGRICLLLAFLAAAITVITGELAEGSFPHSHALHTMMQTHEKIGIAVLVLGGLLVFWSFWVREGKPKRIGLFLLCLGFVSLLVLQNGDVGGRMVFVEGAAVKTAAPEAKSEPIHKEPGHHHRDEDQNHHH